MTNISKDTLWNAARIFRSIIDGLVYHAINNFKFIQKDLLIGGGSSCKIDALDLVTAVENFLGIESSDIKYENISGEDLKTAGNIYVYLYFNLPSAYDLDSCPFIEYNKWFSSWSTIYKDIFKTNFINEIFLTLNRMIKTNSNKSRDGKVEDVLKRISTTLDLKYVDIQNILPQKSGNSSMINDLQLFESSEGMPQCYVKICNNFSFLHDHFQYLPSLTIQCTL